jgi:hypothetical protein
MLVFMHTIGKTLEGNLISLIMKKSSAHNGRQRTLSRLMRMDVSMNIDVNSLMDGKNKNIILLTIKCMLVDKLKNVRNLIAHTTTQILIEDNLLTNFSRSFQRIEVQLYNKHRYINQYS